MVDIPSYVFLFNEDSKLEQNSMTELQNNSMNMLNPGTWTSHGIARFRIESFYHHYQSYFYQTRAISLVLREGDHLPSRLLQ
eukprot:scaffold1048_cov90-Amphora_coffeaeformis.AAC.32